MNTATLAALFMSVSNTLSLPPGLLSALCYVESRHAVHAISIKDGGSDSIGLCQIKLNTARSLGFRGTYEGLRKPEINIKYAGLYLKRQLVRYNNYIPHGVAAYNSGTLNFNKKGQIRNRRYVDKVFSAWEEER